MDENKNTQASMPSAEQTPSPQAGTFVSTNAEPTLASSQPVQAPASVSAPAKSRTRILVPLLLTLLVIVLAAASYMLGYHVKAASYKTSTTTDSMTGSMMAAASVPKGATIIEQCAPGLGTQYIMPKNIPDGPVYNVYQGKLIGIEYMTKLTSLQAANAEIDNLKLYNDKYDHINIMAMPAHAGFPEAHYEIDVMMVPTSVTDKITCGTGSSMMNNSSSSHMSGM